MPSGALAQYLNHSGLRQMRTTANGNCLFNSVSIVLRGSQKYHKVMRREAVTYIRKHSDQFPHLVGEWKRDGLCSIDEYCDWMSEDGAWGDEHMLIALSLVYNCALHVLIHTHKNEVVTQKYGSVSSQHSKPYYITFSCRQEHYSAAIDKNDKNKTESGIRRMQSTTPSKRRKQRRNTDASSPRRSKRIQAMHALYLKSL